jgi:hypothetical protein
LVEAFGYREAISDVNEFESYAYWFEDMKREKEDLNIVKDEKGLPRKSKLMKPEKNKNVVAHAMESVDNYLPFFRSRGYNETRAVRKPKN